MLWHDGTSFPMPIHWSIHLQHLKFDNLLMAWQSMLWLFAPNLSCFRLFHVFLSYPVCQVGRIIILKVKQLYISIYLSLSWAGRSKARTLKLAKLGARLAGSEEAPRAWVWHIILLFRILNYWLWISLPGARRSLWEVPLWQLVEQQGTER